jgi:hypothetical protein
MRFHFFGKSGKERLLGARFAYLVQLGTGTEELRSDLALLKGRPALEAASALKF